MPPVLLQIRVCQNPDCGLRYPLLDSSTFGKRCPACLGETKLITQQPLPRDQGSENDPFPVNSGLSVLLDNIRSALNVGSIFRSAVGFGFDHIYLCGITPTPERPEVRKSALGAEQFIPWSAHTNGVELIGMLKGRGYGIWALERTLNSIPIHSAISTRARLNNLVLVVGNEVTGIDPGILEVADHLVYLPMRGQKRSFNVAVAFALAAQTIQSRVVSNI